MKKSMSKGLAISLTALALTACGGGGDSKSSAGNAVSPSNYVSGTFKYVDEAGLNPTETGTFMSHCSENYEDRVFETARTLVWGSSSLPDDDFKYAGTLVEQKIDSALANFNISYDFYQELKPNVGRNFFQMFNASQFDAATYEGEGQAWFEEVKSIFASNGFSRNVDDIGHIDQGEQYRLAVINMTDEERSRVQELVLANDSFLSMQSLEMVKSEIPEKIIVCLDSSKNGSTWGEGTEVGIDIAPKSVATRSDEGQIIHHELVHHIEQTWTNPMAGVPNVDRWFAEGSAVYFSGMSTHSGTPTSNPIMVKGFIDESNYYSDLGQAYKEYGQAFKYLIDTYGKDAYLNMLDALRYNQVDQSRFWGEGVAFSEEFTVYFTDYSDFEANYVNLVK